MSKNVLIVGMPRSGTSLAAAIFAQKGYFVGESRVGHVRHGDDHNPFGYFEADDVIEENVELLKRAGYDSHNTWLFEPITSESKRRLRGLAPEERQHRLLAAYERRAPWLWKDPRLCYTLACWWPLMDPERTAVLLVRRSPTEIYRSFLRKGWCEPNGVNHQERIREMTRQHLQAAERAIQSFDIPHVAVDYCEYQRRPEEVAQRLSEVFDVGITAESLNYHAELNHSTARGRAAAWLRNQLKKLPRKPVRRIERAMPRRMTALLFPERRFTDGNPPKEP